MINRHHSAAPAQNIDTEPVMAEAHGPNPGAAAAFERSASLPSSAVARASQQTMIDQEQIKNIYAFV